MMKSLKLMVAAPLLTVGVAFACSPIDATFKIDTLSAGVVQVVETSWTTNMTTSPPTRVQKGQTIYGPYRQTDLKTHLAGLMGDSALVFIGRIDTLNYDSTAVLAPAVALTPQYSESGSVYAWVRARVQVDTVLRGSLPSKTFWIKTHFLNSAMCGTTWDWFLNRTFLNASSGLVSTADIKLPYMLGAPFSSGAYWFDGRHLVAPGFPGLRQDITEIFPDYPATSIVGSRNVKYRASSDGKLYHPDGRVVPKTTNRKYPAPLLR